MSGDEAVGRLVPGARVHLVGIGGAGMSALATVLLERGYTVSGSDLKGSRACTALQAMGATVHIGHDAAHVAGADLVAVSAAVPADNPEVSAAAEQGLAVLERAELLAELMRGHRRLLVAGTHGKTTTTAMTTVCLQAAGLDPSYAIGGTLHDAGTSAHAGSGEVFVAEADESDASFLRLEPDCAVVTNVELDHHDHYADLAAVEEVFAAFVAGRADEAGPQLVCCADDLGAARLVRAARGPVVSYGRGEDADLRVVDVEHGPQGSSFGLVERGEDLGRFHIRLPGRHNVDNAAAAVAAARWAGAELEGVRAGLAAFAGAQRRFQRLGVAGGVSVVDDYAHHPTEIAATLAAARQVAGDGRVIAVFQPHRYSRTAALGAELGAALAGADLAVVTEVYGAGEQPVPGVDSAIVADAARRAGATVRVVASLREIPDEVAAAARAGDLVLTLGAGDITEVGPQLLGRLEGRRG